MASSEFAPAALASIFAASTVPAGPGFSIAAVLLPAARPLRMSSSPSPTTRTAAGSTPQVSQQWSTGAGSGLLGMAESRVTIGEKTSGGNSAWRTRSSTQPALFLVKMPIGTPRARMCSMLSRSPGRNCGGLKDARSSSSMIAIAAANPASSLACFSRRYGTTSTPGGTPVRSRIRDKSSAPGSVSVPSMSNSTPRISGLGSHELQYASTCGSSISRLLSMRRSSGATRLPAMRVAELALTVSRITACSTEPTISSAAGASLGYSCVQASSMEAVRSPVPVKGPPSMRGSCRSHFCRPASESIIA
mmetsp:Transcript_143806/g.265225  ORF Transcript_143806/g.265225 Transcript_143806/m.265225 type:complete len:305 (+) Transcript_143806:2-916(+)